MMTFNDIKAFIDFASDPQKYKAVVDDLDSRQKQWEKLVETYTALEKSDLYLARAKKEADSMVETASQEAAKAEEKRTKLLDKIQKQQKDVEQLHASAVKQEEELAAKTTEMTQLVDTLKNQAADYSQKLEKLNADQIEVDALKFDYQEKLKKLNSVLKDM